MLDVEGDERLGELWKATVLAAVHSPLLSTSSCRGIHQEFVCLAKTARAFACKRLRMMFPDSVPGYLLSADPCRSEADSL
jgi:hypothetical protein